MMEPSLRAQMVAEVESLYPLSFPGLRFSGKPLPGELSHRATDIQHEVQKQFTSLYSRLCFDLLYQIHTYFEFNVPDQRVRTLLLESLENLYRVERNLAREPFSDKELARFPSLWEEKTSADRAEPSDAAARALALIRKCWYHNRPSRPGPDTTLLSGLAHVRQAGFFTRVPVELSACLKFFLLTEHYHRLDPKEHERRLDRFHWLQSTVSAIRRLEDLLILLEQELLHHPTEPLEQMSQRLAALLEQRVSPALKPLEPFPVQIYLLLRCHQICLAETWTDSDRVRLSQLLASRRLDSLVDLLLVALHDCVGKHRLPEVGDLLDQLQANRFNIEHEAFRDPYEALLVPIEDTVRFENTPLRLFLSLTELSGDLDRDSILSRDHLRSEHARIATELEQEHAAFQRVLKQPLPKAHLLRQLARYLVSRQLARHNWPPILQPGQLLEQVQKEWPDQVKALLVRPRRGYEVRSRQDLRAILEQECTRQLESLLRVAQRKTIDGMYDYKMLVRYLSLQALSREPADKLQIPTPGQVAKRAGPLGIGLVRPTSDTPETVRAYLNEKIPCQDLLTDMVSRFTMTEQELQQVYEAMQGRFSPLLYQLVVAEGRSRAGSSRVSASPDDLPGIVEILVPPYEALLNRATDQAREIFKRDAAAVYRSENRPCLLDDSEREAYLAWVFHQATTTANGPQSAGDWDLPRLLNLLHEAEKQIDTIPSDPLAPPSESFICRWLESADGAPGVSQQVLQELVRHLPQLHCGACGHSDCFDFARVLVDTALGSEQCPHLSTAERTDLTRVIEWARLQSTGATRSHSPLTLLRHRSLYRGSAKKKLFRAILSPRAQAKRRRFLERVQQQWDHLDNKPAIFKLPEPEVFYRDLVSCLGMEAVERLSGEEKEFLSRHGDHKIAASWQRLLRNQDWLQAARKNRESRPLLQQRDPIEQAQRAYRNVLFLHQLSDRDRKLVLQRRLQLHEDGFSRWWNEDLLILNHPDFSITTWDEFSKIIKNAYWHQEQSLIPGELASHGLLETTDEQDRRERFRELVCHWIHQEQQDRRKRLQILNRANEPEGRQTPVGLDEMRLLLEALAMEQSRPINGPPAGGSRSSAPVQFPGALAQPPTEEEDALQREAIWNRFQQLGQSLSADFFCDWHSLGDRERAHLEKALPDSVWHRLQLGDRDLLANAESAMQIKIAVVQAMIAAVVEKLNRQRVERQMIETARERALSPPLPAAPIQSWIRYGLADEVPASALLEQCLELADRHKPWQEALLQDTLQRLIVMRQYQCLAEESHAILPSRRPDIGWQAFVERHEHWRTLLDQVAAPPPRMDKERLLHSLYLLAKMEGDLDVLTALLREIRETSDIIEAAWLNFTQERLREGPYAKRTPGASLGLPLLASRLKATADVNRFLREGLPRGAKQEVAAAVRELLLYIRFHILTAPAHRSREAEPIATEIWRFGYDLEGIDRDSLTRAVAREIAARPRLQSDRIWIIASATARRLAANNSELLELERRFYKMRLDILKEDSPLDRESQEIVEQRGVALGRIKEAMYRELSDLLEEERVSSFRKRIRQIVDQLDLKRLEIYRSWLDGEVNRRSVFYLLRRFQKQPQPASRDDCLRLLRDHWMKPLADLRTSLRPDRAERIQELDEKFRALFDASFLQWEKDAEQGAANDFADWVSRRLARIGMPQAE